MDDRQLPCTGLTQLYYSTLATDIRRARRLCETCPVRIRCLARALEHREPDGVWGGFTPDERRHLLRTDADEKMYQVVTRVRSSRRGA